MASRPSRKSPAGEGPPPLLGRTELVAAGFLLAGIVVVVGVILLLGGGDDGDGGNGPAPTSAPVATGLVFVPTNEDEQAIEDLARRSIEVLPQDQWPSLYNDFTAEFQARCTLGEFTQAGVDAAAGLGESLSLLGFKFLQDVTIEGDTAEGTIVGELRGQSEYTVQAAFARENGVWKLAPAPNTEGCSAFNRLSG